MLRFFVSDSKLVLPSFLMQLPAVVQRVARGMPAGGAEGSRWRGGSAGHPLHEVGPRAELHQEDRQARPLQDGTKY